jgi:signal transduction histidine kinase
VLRIAFLVVGGLIAYQIAVTLLQPPWINSVTDWLRALLAWPELLAIVFVSWWLTRARQLGGRSGWMMSVALLSYAIARTVWTLDDQFIHPNAVPFPSFPDLFFLLQYPFFFLALALLPGAPPWGSRIKVILDCLLVMGAAGALSWYFLLAPLYLQSGEPPLGKAVNLAYPLWDLCLLFGLTVAFIYRQCQMERAVLTLLIVAFLCLVAADSLAAWLLLYPRHVYRTGYLSDVFWNAFYLLVPLAGLVKFRLTQKKLAYANALPAATGQRPQFLKEDLKAVSRFLLPLVAALLASVLIAIRTIIAPLHFMHPLIPSVVIFSLLLLAFVRQAIMVLENAQLRRAWEQARTDELAAQANAAALRETNRRMESFLGIAGHELKTPLTTLILSLQMLQRRAQHRASQPEDETGQAKTRKEGSQSDLALPLQQAERLNRLVSELLDTSRIQAGQLQLDLKLVDLAAIVCATVEEQRQAFPGRTISLCLPDESMPVLADADRIGQVVTNYLTNALKYSREDRPVEVGVQVKGQQGRVWVWDQGPGLPPAEQERIWERFYRAPGIEIQSGSGIGLGLGLHINKTIIEQHHGQVGVQSLPGQGSTFWFTMLLKVPEEDG